MNLAHTLFRLSLNADSVKEKAMREYRKYLQSLSTADLLLLDAYGDQGIAHDHVARELRDRAQKLESLSYCELKDDHAATA